MRDDEIFSFVSSFDFKEDKLCSQKAHVYRALQRSKTIQDNEAFVEAGVFKGEVSRCVGSFFKKCGIKSPIYLYDTFEGMLPEDPSKHDWKYKHGPDLGRHLVQETLQRTVGTGWVKGALDEVKENVLSSGYDNFRFIKGPVQETLLRKENLPERVKFLWLDVDWYVPSLAVLENLYPRVVDGGHIFFENILTWKGERQAYDELRDRNFLQEEIDPDTLILRRNKLAWNSMLLYKPYDDKKDSPKPGEWN